MGTPDIGGNFGRDIAGEFAVLKPALPLPRPMPPPTLTLPFNDPPVPFAVGPSLSFTALPVAVAQSLSLSPTHAGTTHWPPAIPLTARIARRHLRTGWRVRSRGMVGAKPAPIFGSGCTRNGLLGRRYMGIGIDGSRCSSGISPGGGRAREELMFASARGAWIAF